MPLSSPWQKSSKSGTTGETACPTTKDQRSASPVGQAFSLSGLLPRAVRLSGAASLAWAFLLGGLSTCLAAQPPRPRQVALATPPRRPGLPPCGRPADRRALAKSGKHSSKVAKGVSSKSAARAQATASQPVLSQGCVKNLSDSGRVRTPAASWAGSLPKGAK